MRSLAAIPFDTIAFVVLVIIASFFRWISKEAEKTKRKTEQPQTTVKKQPPAQPRKENDEERVRRFLEALGQPTSSNPPPPIEERSFKPKEKRVVVPGNRKIFSPLPPLTTVPPPLPITPEPPNRPASVVDPAVSRAGIPLTLKKEKIEMLLPTEFPETARETLVASKFAMMLSTAGGLRDAIILREVFGPPRSLQALEY